MSTQRQKPLRQRKTSQLKQKVITMNDIPHRLVFFNGGIACRNMVTNKNIAYRNSEVALKLGVDPTLPGQYSQTEFYIRKDSREYRKFVWIASDLQNGDLLLSEEEDSVYPIIITKIEGNKIFYLPFLAEKKTERFTLSINRQGIQLVRAVSH